MLLLTWQKAIPYAVSALLGTLMVFSLCKLLSKKERVTKILTYIGDRTIDILTWHFLSFKLVSIAITLLYGLSITRLAEFPVIDEYACKGWWLLCLFIGIVIPLFIENRLIVIQLAVKQIIKKIIRK